MPFQRTSAAESPAYVGSPKDHRNKRIGHSGSKAQYKRDSIHQTSKDPDVYVFFFAANTVKACVLANIFWVAVKELNLSYQNSETRLFASYP